jgi:hypothetical protein
LLKIVFFCDFYFNDPILRESVETAHRHVHLIFGQFNLWSMITAFYWPYRSLYAELQQVFRWLRRVRCECQVEICRKRIICSVFLVILRRADGPTHIRWDYLKGIFQNNDPL